jgi:hypothetical protein
MVILEFMLVVRLVAMLKELTLTHLAKLSLITLESANKNACKFTHEICLRWVNYSVRIPVDTFRNIPLTFEANNRMIQKQGYDRPLQT